jgi:general secretion pathway protein G
MMSKRTGDLLHIACKESRFPWVLGHGTHLAKREGNSGRGFTLLELIVTTTILMILTLMALPLARITIKREKERQLRRALWEMRDAIDHYKEAADRGGFQIKADSFGYPTSLDDLVKGVDVGGKKTRFLRRIPVDPMTGTEWGLRSVQDAVDSDSWGGQNVFDVYTKSEGVGLDGTKYSDW